MSGWAPSHRSAARNSAARNCTLPEEHCGSCRYFCQAPHEIESQLPGLRSLGSVFASVRASDGLCRRHDRYIGASSRCAGYESEI
ncbi:MAG: hypothetical protein ACHQDD_00850 [Steroidobacterales bacterium]